MWIVRASSTQVPTALFRSSGTGPESMPMFASTCSTPSRSRRIATTLSSNSVRQLATIASNTGRASLMEPLIADRMRAVAVWRSSDSFVSLNRRTFSMAITAWSRKDSASAIALSLKAFARLLPSTSTPTQASPRSSGR